MRQCRICELGVIWFIFLRCPAVAVQCVNVPLHGYVEWKTAWLAPSWGSIHWLEGSKPPVASDSKASTSTCYRSCMIKKGRCLVTTPDDDVPSRDQDLKIEPGNHNPVGLSAIVIMPMMVLVIKHAFSSCTWCHCHKVQMPVAKKNMSTKRIFSLPFHMSSLLEDWPDSPIQSIPRLGTSWNIHWEESMYSSKNKFIHKFKLVVAWRG